MIRYITFILYRIRLNALRIKYDKTRLALSDPRILFLSTNTKLIIT